MTADRKYFVLVHAQARRLAAEACLNAPVGHVVQIKPPTRSLMQNSRLWSQLSDVAAQVVWHGRKLSAEEWKHVFSASLKRQDVVPNLDGNGFVAMGSSTSGMSKKELSDLMELINAFGVERNVKFSQ